MKKYTIESLKAINECYDREHKVTENDVEKANYWVGVIEGSRNKNTPVVGDIVEFTTKYGDYFKNAHVDIIKDDQIYICERPFVPFVGIIDEGNVERFYTSTGGGTWTNIPTNLKYIGKREKSFKDWGRCVGSGTIEFTAQVNVWEYVDGIPEFTTDNYDRFNVTIDIDRVHSTEYKYQIRKDGESYINFHTDEEYEAWIKTFNGVERPGYWSENQRIVWTYKQLDRCVPLDDYLAIPVEKTEGLIRKETVIDSSSCNGTIQQCKRIYSGTTVETILPHQNNRIELKGVKEYMRAYEN